MSNHVCMDISGYAGYIGYSQYLCGFPRNRGRNRSFQSGYRLLSRNRCNRVTGSTVTHSGYAETRMDTSFAGFCATCNRRNRENGMNRNDLEQTR